MPEKKYEKVKLYKIIVLVLFIFVIIGAFVKNNTNLFQREISQNLNNRSGIEDSSFSDIDTFASVVEDDDSLFNIPTEALPKLVPDISDDDSLYSVDVPSFLYKCTGADKFCIRISLRIFFDNKKNERLLLFKREDIKVILQKILTDYNSTNVNKEKLKLDLKHKINEIFKVHSVVDIQFLDFEYVLKKML